MTQKMLKVHLISTDLLTSEVRTLATSSIQTFTSGHATLIFLLKMNKEKVLKILKSEKKKNESFLSFFSLKHFKVKCNYFFASFASRYLLEMCVFFLITTKIIVIIKVGKIAVLMITRSII
jgi:hypothetical protein